MYLDECSSILGIGFDRSRTLTGVVVIWGGWTSFFLGSDLIFPLGLGSTFLWSSTIVGMVTFLSLCSFIIFSSSSVNVSPFPFFTDNKCFFLAFFAFSALPCSAVSHESFKAFSESSFEVSFKNPNVSDEVTLRIHPTSLHVSGFCC